MVIKADSSKEVTNSVYQKHPGSQGNNVMLTILRRFFKPDIAHRIKKKNYFKFVQIPPQK